MNANQAPLRVTAILALCCIIMASAFPSGLARAQAKPDLKKPAAKSESKPENLADQQRQVAEQFKRLEELLLRMAELSGPSDPRRAALLRKAVAESKERLITVQFDALVELIKKEELSRAIDGQGAVDKDLLALLELLMSENRAKRLESEKARLREYIKQISAIINQQKGIQGRTAGGAETDRLAAEQGKLAGKTGELAKQIRANEESKPGQKSDGKDQGQGAEKGPRGEKSPKKENKSSAEKKDGGQQSDSKGKNGKQQEGAGDAKSQGNKKSDSGGKAPSKSQGQPQGEGQGQEQSQDQGQTQDQSQQDNPARKRLDAAQQRMREAEKKLEEAQRKGATEKQEEALRELEQAKADLEKILRQLREEEIERVLTMLEARFAKMLQMQRAVLEATIKLDKVPQAERSHSHEIESGRLSGKEAEIDMEAEKAMNLLRDDGSAVAFPEALDLLRHDVRQVVERLAQTKVDTMTQGIEEDIVASLEEMIKALEKARKDMEQRRQQGQPQSGQPADPPLVDILAEIKMIRALQMRVNTRTQRYSKMVAGEQATNQELIDALKRLAEQEQRIKRITHDLSTGKNR